MRLEVLFENDDYIIVNKPAGLLTIPDRFNASIPCLLRFVEEKKNTKLWVVHRLDRETSGIIAFAKNAEAHKYLSALFLNRQIEKRYTAFVHGIPSKDAAEILAPLMPHPGKKGIMVVNAQGKPAHTTYVIEKKWGKYALLNLQIHTGRTHQIRVHMQAVGHPLLCDVLYGDGQPVFLSQFKKKFKQSKEALEEQPLFNRLALHASSLKFTNAQGEAIEVVCPLPKDLAALEKQLDKWS